MRVLFPQFWKLDAMVRGEITGLNDQMLDWTSAEFGWAGWSIRQQSSHLGSLVFRWLLVRWRNTLFPDGLPIPENKLSSLNSADHDRRLNDDLFHSPDQILGAVSLAMSVAQSVLQRFSIAEGRQLSVTRSPSLQWPMMVKAHPRGVTLNSEGGGTLTLEATFRHIYFEYLTHLYNIQRIKHNLGEPIVVRLPNDGYHTVRGWE